MKREIARFLLVTSSFHLSLFAGAPVITELQPRGAERGRAFTLTVVGRNLGEGARVSSALPAAFTPLGSSRDGGAMPPGRSASFLVEPRGETTPGVYPI
ncbi:MAG: hypothetical protein ACRD7E_14045, partial [Bryobacteraceae bacterium]